MKSWNSNSNRTVNGVIAGFLSLGLPTWAAATGTAKPSTAVAALGQTEQPGDPSGFSMAFLQGAYQAADVKSLLLGSEVMAGTYRVDIYTNGDPAGRRDVTFSVNPGTGQVEPCFTAELLTQAGVDIRKLEAQGKALQGACLRLPELIEQASAHYDAPRLRLNLSVPQAYMSASHRGYVDPSLWEDGVPAAFVNYSLNSRRGWSTRTGGSNDRSTSVGLQMGANLGAWRLRNNSYLTTGSRQSTQFQSQNTYLQRGLNGIKSQLQIGETYTNSPLFDGVQFQGVQLASDEAMRPDNEQGYAPVIRGNAESNATVEVRQNGYLIYSATVAPGPFEITDLSPSGSNGDMEITVIEADGSRRVQRQAFSSPPLMVREGRVRYDGAFGRFKRNGSGGERPIFGSASLLYGVSGNVTLAAGLQASAGYQAYSLGAGVNTRAGAVSLDATHSISKNDGKSLSGDKLDLRYGKFLEDTNTNVSVNYQRSLNDGFRSLSDHVYAKNRSDGVDPYASRYGYTRSRVDAYLAQNLGQGNRYGSLYLSGSDARYWDDSRSRSLSVGYSNSLGRVSYNLGYSHMRNVNGGPYGRRYSDNLMSLTLSFPLGSGAGAPQGYTSLNRQGSGSSVQAGVGGQLPTERDIGYSITAGRGMDGGGSGSAAASTTTSFARLGAGYSYGNHYHATTLSANGSVVAHGGGVNLGQSVGDTFLLAKVDPPVAGVGLSSYAGAETGRNGYAVVPSATPFRSNWVGLDTRKLTAEVEFDNAMQQIVPTRGAIGQVTFKADTGRRVQFELTQPDGKPMAFGATVDDADGNRLGITDPRGRVLAMLSEDKEKGELLVRWNELECRIPYALPARTEGENYQRISLKCDSARAIERKNPPRQGPLVGQDPSTKKL